MEDVKAKQVEIRGLDQAAAEREAKSASLETDIGVLGGQVAALPPPGDAGEFNGQRQQLLAELRDVGLQVSGRARAGRLAGGQAGWAWAAGGAVLNLAWPGLALPLGEQ